MQCSSRDQVHFLRSQTSRTNIFLWTSVLDGTVDPVTDTVTATLKSAVQMYCRIYQSSLKGSSYYIEQCGCDVEVKEGLFLSDPPYNVLPELGRQTSDYDLFTKNVNAVMVDMWVVYLKFGVHAHITCSLVQLSSLAKDASAPAKSITFQGSESNELIRTEALCPRKAMTALRGRPE